MKKFLFLFLCLCSLAAQAQLPSTHSTISDQFSKSVSVPNSPEAEAFSQYGQVDVNLHTGAPNIAVPLYTIKGQELDIPVSLTYNASGIKVAQVASNVGLGWNLNVGGRVSRQVRGLPDDYESALNPYYSLQDLSVRTKLNRFKDFNGVNYLAQLKDSSLMSEQLDSLDYLLNFLDDVQTSEADIEQDYYSVNVLGLNETIWMDTNTHDAIALNNPNIKVEILWLGNYGTDGTVGAKVVDEQGNQYFFGNYADDNPNNTPPPFSDLETDPIERVKRISNNDTPGNMTLSITYRSSWLLNRIVSANGKDVYDFQYTTGRGYDSSEHANVISGMKTHSLKMVESTNGANHEYVEANNPPNNIQSVTDVQSNFQQNFLTTIYRNGKEVVKFDFEDRDDLHDGTDKAIKSFSVYEDFSQNTNAIQKITFDYDYFGQSITGDPQDFYNKRLRLDRIDFGVNSVKNFYEFEYNDPLNVPRRTSYAQDYMGYYNGENGNVTLFEQIENLSGWNGTYTLYGANRDVNINYSQIGTLNKIVYPTGGHSEFIFENHTDGTVNYPGLRIKEIKSYESMGGDLAFSKSYQYLTDFNGATSSLVENFQPILHKEVSIQSNPTLQSGCAMPYEVSNPTLLYRYSNPPNIGSHPYITYDKVFEVNYDDTEQKGYTRYDFYNNAATGWYTTNSSPPYEKGYYNNYDDGKVHRVEIFDKDHTNLSTQETTYTTANYYTDQAVVFNRDLMFQYGYLTYQHAGGKITNIFRSLLTSAACTFAVNGTVCDQSGYNCIVDFSTSYPSFSFKQITINGANGGAVNVVKTAHFPTGDVVTTTTNEYVTNSMFPRASNVTTGDGEQMRMEYTYLEDIDESNRTAAQQKLIDQNKKSTPVESTSKKIYTNGTSVLLSTQKTTFQVLPEINGIDPVVPLLVESGKGTGALEPRINYNQYNADGNLVDVSLEDGTSMSYIWGYDGMYPVAKIQNMEYGLIPSTLISDIEAQSSPTGNEASLLVALDALRNHLALANAQVTTYTYKPMIGVHTVTDPRGYRVYYHYDEHNRLKYIKDPDGNVLGENEYNYRINN